MTTNSINHRATHPRAFRKTVILIILTLACVSTAPAQTQQTTGTIAAPTARSDAANASTPRDEKLYRRALRLHRDAILVDGHNDITTMMLDDNYDLATPSAGKYHTDLARMKQGGITGQFFSIYIDNDFAKRGAATRRALDMIDVVYRDAERHPNEMMMATSVADIRRAKRAGKIAALMGIENGAAIDNSLHALRDFYRLGIRYMTLTHNFNNDWADAARDTPKHDGLSDFGKQVVAEMNRLGMLVDVSHVHDLTMSDVLDVARAPVIASHSSAKALCNHPRNISDELLRRIAKNGGVVMVNFYPAFIDQKVYDASRARDERLKPELDKLKEQYKENPKQLEEESNKLLAANPLPTTPLSVLIDHIDHIRKVAGIDHVGLGSDFDGVPSLPENMKSVADLPNITYELLRRGYSDEDVRKVLGGNFLRAFSEAERAKQSRKG